MDYEQEQGCTAMWPDSEHQVIIINTEKKN